MMWGCGQGDVGTQKRGWIQVVPKLRTNVEYGISSRMDGTRKMSDDIRSVMAEIVGDLERGLVQLTDERVSAPPDNLNSLSLSP